MNLELHTVSESEGNKVGQFLRGVFQASDDALFTASAQMQWKCWEPRPDWNGSRSFAFEDGSGGMIAHLCAWPFSLCTNRGTFNGLHPIDWASAKTAHGTGTLLLRQVLAMRDFGGFIGGSNAGQKTIRQAGYQPVVKMHMLARPLRPWLQASNHQRRNWKLPARVLRNSVWAARSTTVPAGWSCEPIQPANFPAEILPTSMSDIAVVQRSPELFAYMMKCPTARYELRLICRSGEPRGYALLSFVPGQARIADAWVASGNSEEWRTLYALCIQAALDDGAPAEIVATVTLDHALRGAQACGFRAYQQTDVLILDPQRHFADMNRFHVQMLENDMSFLRQNHIEYVT